MKLISVNVSQPRPLEHDGQIVKHEGQIVTTGIYKRPVAGRVMLRQLNLDGDRQADLQSHGGIYQAVYAYSIENYDHWARELGRSDFEPGQFGENLTVQGMTEDQVHIGDVFRIGGALVQVTQARVPCFKLAMKMGLPEFPKQFLGSRRTGFYLRVLEEGEVGTGDPIERVQTDPERLTVSDLVHLAFFETTNQALGQRAMRVQGLSPEWRERIEKKLSL